MLFQLLFSFLYVDDKIDKCRYKFWRS